MQSRLDELAEEKKRSTTDGSISAHAAMPIPRNTDLDNLGKLEHKNADDTERAMGDQETLPINGISHSLLTT